MDAIETSVYEAIILLVILIGIVIGIFAWSITRSQKEYFRSRKGQVVEELRLFESERSRIARDLHDELGPVLAMSYMQLRKLATSNAANNTVLDTVTKNLQGTIGTMRDIARNLHRNVLNNEDLEPLLVSFLEQLSESNGLELSSRIDLNNVVPPETGLHIFRMVQEMAYNTVKHADARNIFLSIAQTRRWLILQYRDDGKGFDANEVRKGIGLQSMQDRACLLGGNFRFESVPGEGTAYIVRLPGSSML